MQKKKLLRLSAVFGQCIFAGACFGQLAPEEPKVATSICFLQERVSQGHHQAVRVSGVFRLGLELGTLEDAACPKETTWVELALRTKQNKEQLGGLLDRSQRAYVVFEGEFYGPPLADPNLPEAIQKSYHPGWGHLAAFKTKLVVYAIREVKAAPADHPKEPH